MCVVCVGVCQIFGPSHNLKKNSTFQHFVSVKGFSDEDKDVQGNLVKMLKCNGYPH